MVLAEEGFYKISQEYLGKSSKKFENHGQFMWDAQGSQLLLRGVKGGDVWLRVGENKVDVLDNSSKILWLIKKRYKSSLSKIDNFLKIDKFLDKRK